MTCGRWDTTLDRSGNRGPKCVCVSSHGRILMSAIGGGMRINFPIMELCTGKKKNIYFFFFPTMSACIRDVMSIDLGLAVDAHAWRTFRPDPRAGRSHPLMEEWVSC